MAHDHLKESIEAQTGRSSALLIATFMGGLLVVNSFIAQYLFDDPEISGAFAGRSTSCILTSFGRTWIAPCAVSKV